MSFSPIDRTDLLKYLQDTNRKLYGYLYNNDDDDSKRYFLEKTADNKSFKIWEYDRNTQRETLFRNNHSYPRELYNYVNEIIEELKKLNITKYQSVRPLIEADIQNFITHPTNNYYRNIFDDNINRNEYYLYKNHQKTQIELYLNDKNIHNFEGIHSIDQEKLFMELKDRKIIYTTNPSFTKPQEGGKRRSKSRVRRKRSQKRKKYKRRHHTHRKFKTKF